MAFGVFEANLSSDQEAGRAKQEFLDKRNAAVYDVREKLGPMLFAAQDVEQFRHLVAMMKHDQSVYKIIGEHLLPSAGVVRSIVGQKSILEKEFKARLAAGIEDFGKAPVGGNTMPASPPTDPEIGTPSDTPSDNLGGTGGGGGNAGLLSNPRAEQLSGVPQPENPPGMMASRRSADFNGENDDLKATFKPSDSELIPEDNWDGYLKSVDQKSDKATSNVFTSSTAFQVYADWAQANRMHPLKLSTLDRYATNISDQQYFHLASGIQVLASSDEPFPSDHHPKTPKGQSPSALKNVTANTESEQNFNRKLQQDNQEWNQKPWHKKVMRTPPYDAEYVPKQGSVDPLHSYVAWCRHHGLKRISANNVAYYAGPNTQLAIHLAQRMKRAIHTARLRQAKGDYEGWEGQDRKNYSDTQDRDSYTVDPDWEKEYDKASEEELGRRHKERGGEGNPDPREFWKDSRRHQACYPGCDKNEAHAKKFHNKDKEASRRQAAPDYLQKADDALTQLLNQKAQEFQETIQPLQQALMTVQQAEQLAQQQNPMNVLPPPGTVNVMPQAGGGDANGPSTAGQVGMPDPNAPDTSGLAQMLAQPGGGAPDMSGLDGTAPGGGTEDPNAPPPALQQQARRRGGSGKAQGATRPRQAAGYEDMHDPSAYGPNPALHNPNLDRPYTGPGRSLAEQQAARDKAVQEAAQARVQQRKQANSVFDLWHKWQTNRGQSGNLGMGGDPDYEAFSQEMGVGQRALNKLKNHHQTGVTVGSKHGYSFPEWTHATHPGVSLDYDLDGPSRSKIIHEYQLDPEDYTPHQHQYKSKGVGKGKELVSMRKGAPFAGYDDFDDCTSQNSDKGDPDAYCGEIKHRTEDKKQAGVGQWLDQHLPTDDDVRGLLKRKGPQPGGFIDRHMPTDDDLLHKITGQPHQAARQRYLAWCERNNLKAANTKNFYWYAAKVHPREAALLTANEHDYDPANSEQIFAPARGHGWEHSSGPSGRPYERPQQGPGRHEGGWVGPYGDEDTTPEEYAGTAREVDEHFRKQKSEQQIRDKTKKGHRKQAIPDPLHLADPAYLPKVKPGKGWEGYPTAVPGVIMHQAPGMAGAGAWGLEGEQPQSHYDFEQNHPDIRKTNPYWPPQLYPGHPKTPYYNHHTNKPDAGPQRQASRKQAWSGWGPAQFPKTRKVAGWDWNDYLNGYESNSPRHFQCSCGDQFPAPSGFHRCACGRQWNSYVIGNGGPSKEASTEKFLVREIPVRPDVIVANNSLNSPYSEYLRDHIDTHPGATEEDAYDSYYRDNPQYAPSFDRHTEIAPGVPKHKLLPKGGALHNLVDPGELEDGEDDGMPTFKQPPKDWARRGDGARWTKSPIGG